MHVSGGSVPEVTVTEAEAARAGGAVLVDVREPDEWGEVHAAGALHLPLGDVPTRFTELPTGGAIYVICRSGARSMRAAEFLRTQGIDARNVAGGTMAWVEAGLPTVTGDGTAG